MALKFCHECKINHHDDVACEEANQQFRRHLMDNNVPERQLQQSMESIKSGRYEDPFYDPEDDPADHQWPHLGYAYRGSEWDDDDDEFAKAISSADAREWLRKILPRLSLAEKRVLLMVAVDARLTATDRALLSRIRKKVYAK